MDTKKLRQKILDLAIHGKLVPQDPNDEPASVLLERISKEKERLIKEGKIKRNKQAVSSDLSPDDVPFELPEGWCWCVLNDIALFGGGKTPSMDNKLFWDNGHNLWVTSKDMKSKEISDSMMKITDEALKEMNVYEPGTILIVTRSGILRHTLPLSILTQKATVNQDLKTISVIAPCMYVFVFYAILAREVFILKEFHKDGTTVDSINFDKFVNLPIPLPPLAEQKRIVSAVEQWMSVIDVLENNEEDLRQSIDKAKSKILDLAIRGKLVPQDSNDEPASDLLKRLGISPDNCPCEDLPFELPNSWCWTCMGECNKYKSASIDPAKTPNGDYELYSVPTFETGMPEFVKGKEISSSKKSVKQGDVLLCKINPHLNRVWIVLHHKKERVCIASSEWIVFRNESFYAKYLIYCFQSLYFKDLMLSNVSGVGGSLMRRIGQIAGCNILQSPIDTGFADDSKF